MSKRQAHTLMALAVAIIVTQVLCTAVLLRSLERSRNTANVAQLDAVDYGNQDIPTIATDVGGEATQAAGSSVTAEVDHNYGYAVIAPAAPPPPPAEPDPVTGEAHNTAEQRAATRAEQQEQYLTTGMLRALRNAAAAHPTSVEP